MRSHFDSLLVYVLLSAGALLHIPGVARAQTNGPVTYVYDELGRLTGVIDGSGLSATYQYDAVGNLLAITRGAAGQLSIIEFNPNAGPVGSTVTIFGTGFSATPGLNTVKFNGTIAAVSSSSTTQIVASVPAGATTGTISVTVSGNTVTSGSAFSVTTAGPPTISGFSPAIGVSGTVLTVSGTNFDPTPINDQLSVNTMAGSVTAAAPTSLSVTTPRAGSGKIAVGTPLGRATSGADYYIAPPPYTAADVLVTDRMNIGSTRHVSMSAGGKIGLVLFDGAAGQRVSLDVTNLDFASGSVSMIRPDGTLTGSPTSIFQSGGGFLDATPLLVGGSYTILVDPDLSQTGTLDLTLYDVPPDVSTSITPGGAPVSITTTAPGQNARLGFTGTAGQRVSLKLSGVTIDDSAVSLLRPEGIALGSSTVVGPSGAFREPDSLPTSGSYTVLVDPTERNTGSMTLTLYNVPPDISGTITIGGPSVIISPSVPGQKARLTFQVTTPNQQIKLKWTSVTITSGKVSIFKPNGNKLGADAFFSTATGSMLRTPPVTGTYTVVVDPDQEYTGSMTLTLTLTS